MWMQAAVASDQPGCGRLVRMESIGLDGVVMVMKLDVSMQEL
jgi:hypothetical protein